jgi:hypothetical protein
MRYFMTTLDHSRDEHLDLLELSRILKLAEQIRHIIQFLPGAFPAIILEEQASDCYIKSQLAYQMNLLPSITGTMSSTIPTGVYSEAYR